MLSPTFPASGIIIDPKADFGLVEQIKALGASYSEYVKNNFLEKNEIADLQTLINILDNHLSAQASKFLIDYALYPSRPSTLNLIGSFDLVFDYGSSSGTQSAPYTVCSYGVQLNEKESSAVLLDLQIIENSYSKEVSKFYTIRLQASTYSQEAPAENSIPVHTKELTHKEGLFDITSYEEFVKTTLLELEPLYELSLQP